MENVQSVTTWEEKAANKKQNKKQQQNAAKQNLSNI
jgi:hypothetical protein